MKNIDDLLNENLYLFGAVRVLIDSAQKNHDFKALYKYDRLREEDYKRNSMKYFIDYSEDAVLPSAGKASLVDDYAKIMNEFNTPIEIFDTREEMLESVAEMAEYAKDGVSGEDTFTDEELLYKISKKDASLKKTCR